MAERVFREHYNPMNGMITDSHVNSWLDEIIIHSYQTDAHKQKIAAQNRELQNTVQRGTGRMRLVARVPEELHVEWEREFKKGEHNCGDDWDRFITAKLNQREFSYFRTVPGKI